MLESTPRLHIIAPIFISSALHDSKITMKDMLSGKISVLYDAKEAISKLHVPTVKDPKVRKRAAVDLFSINMGGGE